MGMIVDLLGTFLTGGLTGLAGTVITGLLTMFTAKQANAHELELRKLDNEQARIEGASAEKIAATRAESEERTAEYGALRDSYRHAMKRFTEGYELTRRQVSALLAIDIVRGLMRPVLTLAFLALTAVIYFKSGMTGISEIDSQSENVRLQIINTILYLNVTCVTWWFGDRRREQAKKQAGA